MKNVPFYPNSQDNYHCLQACVKSIIACYLQGQNLQDKEIDNKTGQMGGWTWLPHTVCWLDDLGLSIKIYSTFDYEAFSKKGLKFLEETWDPERFRREKEAGSFANIPSIQSKAKKMIKKGLWINKNLSDNKISKLLKERNVLVLAKTIYELLDGNLGSTAHYVVLIEGQKGKWVLHDPGLPPSPNRIVSKKYKTQSILGDGDKVIINGLKS